MNPSTPDSPRRSSLNVRELGERATKLAERNELLEAEIRGLTEQLGEVGGDLHRAEKELRSKRAQIEKLKKTLREQQADDPRFDEAREVFDYWVAALKKRKNTEFDGERCGLVLARLKGGATVDELKRAIDGCAAFPYVTNNGRSATGEKRQRYDDLELICRHASKVDAFIKLADVVEEERRAKNAEAALLPTKATLKDCINRLAGREDILTRIHDLKGWTLDTLVKCGIGWDGKRLTIPVLDEEGDVLTVLRYLPNGQPKMMAPAGKPRTLYPAPESFPADEPIWLVEGEPDAISGRELGLNAVAIPGTAFVGKAHEWGQRFAGRDVIVCFDCDEAGRNAASLAAPQLARFAARVRIVDLDGARTDGYDLSDALVGGVEPKALDSLAQSGQIVRPAIVTRERKAGSPTFEHRGDPYENLVNALEAKGCKVRGKVAQCPAHEDRHESLSIDEGEKGAIFKCFRGCAPDAILDALGLEWKDVFYREAS